MSFFGRHAQGFGLLLGVGQAAELGGQALLHTFEATSERAHAARCPVGGTGGIEDGTPDALSGEALERDPTGLVVASSRFDQTERTGPGQIVTIDVSREVHRNLVDHVLHEWQVLLNEHAEARIGRG